MISNCSSQRHVEAMNESLRESRRMKLTQEICGLILAYQLSLFPVDVDLLPKMAWNVKRRITAFCLCVPIFTKGVHMFRACSYGESFRGSRKIAQPRSRLI